MKVLLLNGSPHEKGCVFTALSEIASTLTECGVESEIFWIGNKPVAGCVACGHCRQAESNGCAFADELYTSLVQKVRECDGFIVGSPVYYAGPNGSLCALLDRLFFSAVRYLKHKPAACVVNCRRGGASAAFDRLNKYFTMNQMPQVTSQYWNSTHGFKPEDVLRDLEGLQTMRTLARNMAYMLKTIATSQEERPAEEAQIMTNFSCVK